MTATVAIARLSDLLSLDGFRKDLEGPRTRGSLTVRGLEDLSDRDVTEFRPEDSALDVPVARYFRWPAVELGGLLGAVRFGDLTEEQDKLFDSRRGPHGREFFLDVDPADADLPPATIGVGIIGPSGTEKDEEGTEVLDADGKPIPVVGWWTWYVATEATLVVGTVEAQGEATGHPMHSIGVKLHNGE